MPISFNGAGTVTGIVSGGLPGGVITSNNVAIDAIQSIHLSAGVVTASKIADSTITASKLGYQNFSFRNRIINGGMDVWQRGTSSTSNSNIYLADRWQSQILSAGSGTTSQETTSLPTGSRYAWKFVSSGSNTAMQMGQQIEYANCLDLQNTTVSISFMARSVNDNAGSTGLTVRTRTIAGVDGACMFTGEASNTSVTLTTTWTRYTLTRTLPATFGSLSLEFVLGSHVSGDGIMLSQIQLEAGSTATEFERRPFGMELALCQRYTFRRSADGSINNYAPFGPARYYGTNQVQFFISFPCTMRTPPSTLTQIGNIFVNGTGFGGAPLTTIALNEAAADGATVTGITTTGVTAGNATTVYSDDTSNAALIFNAEL